LAACPFILFIGNKYRAFELSLILINLYKMTTETRKGQKRCRELMKVLFPVVAIVQEVS
jgi:hypothetical protein